MTTPPPEPFTVNGRYEVGEKPLGEGSMSSVYKAYDAVTKRFVALKTIRSEADPATLGTFEHEWTTLGHLSHANIVDILDTGNWTFNGQRRSYFVMPLLPGNTLDHLIKTSSDRLTVERSIDIMTQACRGLQAAHDQGLIHRDIKPSNIFVMEDDTVKIIDFSVVHSADLHNASGLKGTPLSSAPPERMASPSTVWRPAAAPFAVYMAPEQVERKPATTMSDIYSLGVVCYEMLTGRRPFERETEAEMAEAIRTFVPPPAFEINPAVNEAISRTVHKAMAKQPYHRFSSAREFSETLQKALRNEPIERFEQSKIQPRIERVKKAYAEGDYQFAREIFTELESEGPLGPEMSLLRAQIEEATRQENIRRLLDHVRIRMDEEEYPLALQKVADVLSIDRDNADAHALKAQIERLRSEAEMESWFRLAREHGDNHLFGQARQALDEILKLDSGNAQAGQMLAEIDKTEREIIKTNAEKQRLYESAVTSYRGGEVSAALAHLERVLALSRRETRSTSPDLDAQCLGFYNRVRGERDAARNAYAEGRKHILEHNVGRALEICDEYLERHPGDPMFQALKLEAEELQRQQLAAALAEVNRRVETEPDLDKKYNLLKEAVEEYPDEPHFRSTMKLIRDRRDLVNTIVGRAHQYEERSQFDDASGQWDILRNIYPLFPGIDSEVKRLAQRRQEQAQVESKARWMEQIDEHFNAGDYAKAHVAIGEALGELPDNQELLHLLPVAEQGVKRGSEAGALLKEGQDLCAARHYEEGLAALRKAERLDPRNGMVRAALITGLVAGARELLSKDWRAAEPLVKEALDLEPGGPVARSLLAVLDDRRRQDAVANILLRARNCQADGHFSDALQLVERGLVQYPIDPRLTQLLSSLRTESAQASMQAPRPGKPTAAAVETESQRLPAASESTQPELSARAAGHPLNKLPASRSVSLSAPPPRKNRPQTTAVTSPQFRTEEAKFKGSVWGIAAVAALALIIAAGVYSLTHRPKSPVPEARRVILADARASAAPLMALPDEPHAAKAGGPLRPDAALTPESAPASAHREGDNSSPVRFFENGKSWQLAAEASGWWVHPGSGYSSMRSSTGIFSFDFFKIKTGSPNREINILADCSDRDNCIIYALDSHDLTSKVIAGGATILDEKRPHGMDSNSSYRLLFEMSPDAIVVKNRAGSVLSSVGRTNPRGKLSIQDDTPLNVN